MFSPLKSSNQILVYLTILNLSFCKLQESAMNQCRHIDLAEQERLIDLYYIIEMKFILERIIYKFEEERYTTL